MIGVSWLCFVAPDAWIDHSVEKATAKCGCKISHNIGANQIKGELKMKKILLVCNAGMSTSMLVAKMKKAAEILFFGEWAFQILMVT